VRATDAGGIGQVDDAATQMEHSGRRALCSSALATTEWNWEFGSRWCGERDQDEDVEYSVRDVVF
jgi:hypothetical protein